MKPIAIWFVLVVAGLVGCGRRVMLDYANADQQRIETGETSAERASQQRLKFEVAADLDRQPPKATQAEVAAAEPPSPKRTEGSPLAVTIFIGGIHFHGDTVIEAERPVQVPQPIKATKQRDDRCQRLRREHEERLADWLSRFD